MPGAKGARKEDYSALFSLIKKYPPIWPEQLIN